MNTQSIVNKRVAIVYFAYINASKDYKKLIREQISDVESSGVLSVADIFVEVNISDDINCKASLDNFFFSLNIDFKNIHYTKENSFEYEGISKLYDLALSQAYDYLCYFHTKGMSYKKNSLFNRSPREIVLTYLNFCDYKRIIEVFDSNEEISKIAPFPGFDEEGDIPNKWCWFNFFWIKSSFASKLDKPIKTSDRFYYESWINTLSSRNLCYSLYSKQIYGFTGPQASRILKKLSKLYKLCFPFSRFYIKLMYFFHK